MNNRDLTALGNKVILKLDSGELLNREDLEILQRIQGAATQRHLIGIYAWLGFCVLVLVVIQLIKLWAGYYDKGTNSVVFGVWILSSGIICCIPDFGLGKIRRRMKCSRCHRRIGDSKQRFEKLIARGRCPYCSELCVSLESEEENLD